jgi:hypothetical protein
MAQNQGTHLHYTEVGEIVSSPSIRGRVAGAPTRAIVLAAVIALTGCSDEATYAENTVEDQEMLYLSCSGLMSSDAAETFGIPAPMTLRFAIDPARSTVSWLKDEDGQFYNFCEGQSNCSVTIDDHAIHLKSASAGLDFDRMDGKLNFSVSEQQKGKSKKTTLTSLMLCTKQSQEDLTRKAF